MIDTIAVIGSGTMGRGIAQTLAVAGYNVLVFDQRAEAAQAAVDFAGQMLDRATDKARMTREDAQAAKDRLLVVNALSELAPAQMAIEAIAESLDAKQALFAQLEQILGADAVLATNTSSLSVSAIAAGVSAPGRVVGLHFFNPVPLMKMVEVIPGLRTDPAATDAALSVAHKIGYRAILCRDAPGFLINHAGRGLLTEGSRIVQDCLASEADVDRVMRDAAGFRMGPFELLDLTGLDVSYPVLQLIYGQFHQEPRYRPGVHLAARVAAGLHGRKTGEGFYRYAAGRRVDPPEKLPPDGTLPRLWVPPEMRADLAQILPALVGAGVEMSDTAQGAVCLLAPYGLDATEAALKLELDPACVMAIDPLTVDSPRVTIMPTPATVPDLCDQLHRALLLAGKKVTRIADSPGFVAQRILAMVVNTGCEISQMQIAAPADIDDGVRLGLGYPHGPLALGDTLGPQRVLGILEALQRQTGDPRYRPSQYLRQRARLGLPLAT
ncbi:3-hydroxyacyl-CoA dehydrogenase [Puniceibacterium sp. IMCC21224]|uniref:3-hydroxyacyl-CoA dehydrogenase n=1 Tax=Puniceibacterium sp. IMCC21224 TaxID=1618204 RepID=UPI001E47BAD2|nr:3-hydroxyacyl-CoA dehydrogenase [Puniceibacterium sp. IMCC21224]